MDRSSLLMQSSSGPFIRDDLHALPPPTAPMPITPHRISNSRLCYTATKVGTACCCLVTLAGGVVAGILRLTSALPSKKEVESHPAWIAATAIPVALGLICCGVYYCCERNRVQEAPHDDLRAEGDMSMKTQDGHSESADEGFL